MLAVVTRVKNARVEIENASVGAIEKGLLVLLGVSVEDSPADVDYVADRVTGMRIFEDSAGKMNISPKDAGAALLVVSQFTLCGDVSQRRPSFMGAARPEQAVPLYERFISRCREAGFSVQCGVFGADMQVFSQNDGPVTLLVDSAPKRGASEQ